MGALWGFLPRGNLQKIGPINFVQNIQDCSSNCPKHDRIKKIGGSLPSKFYISFHYFNVKLSRASLYTVGPTLKENSGLKVMA
jgi:hypothetical protein